MSAATNTQKGTWTALTVILENPELKLSTLTNTGAQTRGHFLFEWIKKKKSGGRGLLEKYGKSMVLR